MKVVLRYHEPGRYKGIEKYSHYLFFSFYSFRNEVDLKSPVSGTYFKKTQEPGVMEGIKKNKSMMEPYSHLDDEGLMRLSHNMICINDYIA